MVLAAVEQYEAPARRLVHDDLALSFLPTGSRWFLRATRFSAPRRLLIATMEKSGPGMWASLTCRKHFIDDKLDEALADIDAVVILGSGLDTRAYRLARRTDVPVFEVDLPTPASRLVFTLVRKDFIDGANLYGAKSLYRRFREKRQIWRFGLAPEMVPAFLGDYGWRVIDQAGPDEIVQRYIRPAGRNLTASEIEWSVYAEKL
jgi:O-methyltransferase involved in polyketide biosynthesis